MTVGLAHDDTSDTNSGRVFPGVFGSRGAEELSSLKYKRKSTRIPGRD